MNQIPKGKRNGGTLTIGLIILVSAILRLINLGSMSLSNDELSSLVRVRYDSFSEMISKGVYIDFHPAGLQSFLFYWVKLVGEETFMVRFPFVVFSLISTWLIYKIGAKADLAMDVVNLKISKLGGLTKIRQARDLCASDVPCARVRF